MHLRLIIIPFFLLLSACAGVSTTPQNRTSDAPTFSDTHARALYLFSRARISAHEEDYPAALNLLREAITFEPDSALMHSEVAEIKLKIGQIPEALEYIDKAIALDPGYRPPYVLGGVIMASAGKDREAASYLRGAVKLDPAKEDAYLHLVMALMRLFEYEETVSTLKSLVKLNPDSVLGHYYLGRTYSQMRLYRDAIGYFSKVLELRPEFDQAVIDKAATHEALGEYPNAILAYQSLVDQEGEQRPAVLQRLTQLLLQQRRFPEALKYLQLAARTGLGGQETARKIGLVHLELEQYDEAITVFTGMLEKDSSADNIRIYLGVAYEGKEELDEALAEFGKISRKSPQFYEAVSHRALILKELGDTDAAITLLTNEITSNPRNLELYLNLSSLYESIDRPQAALDTLLEHEDYFQKEQRFHFRVGILFDKLGKRSESIKRMKHVLQLDPKDAQALNYLGYTYAEMGIHLEEALDLVKRAVAIRPRDAFMLDSLGWAYYKLKRYDEASEALEEALELVNDDPTVIEHLGDVYAARHLIRKAIKQYKRALEFAPEQKGLTEKIHKLRVEHNEK